MSKNKPDETYEEYAKRCESNGINPVTEERWNEVFLSEEFILK